MSKLFSRWLPCATLLIWSLVLLYYAELPASMKGAFAWTHLFTGHDSFLHPSFRPGVLIAGLVMFFMAMMFVFFPANAACCDAANCGHPISRSAVGKWLSFLVLVVPISVTARVSPDTFSKDAINNRGVIMDGAILPTRSNKPVAPVQVAKTTQPASPADLSLPLPTKDPAPAQPASAPSAWPDAPSTKVGAPAVAAASATPAPTAAVPASTNDYLQRTPDGHIVAEVLDLLYAAQDNVLRKDFEGKTVELIGQLMPDTTNNPNGNRFKAVRMFMTCCAADARPVATLVEAGSPTTLPEMTWIKITGTATFPVENGRRTAVLKADKVEKTEPPSETMLY